MLTKFICPNTRKRGLFMPKDAVIYFSGDLTELPKGDIMIDFSWEINHISQLKMYQDFKFCSIHAPTLITNMYLDEIISLSDVLNAWSKKLGCEFISRRHELFQDAFMADMRSKKPGDKIPHLRFWINGFMSPTNMSPNLSPNLYD